MHEIVLSRRILRDVSLFHSGAERLNEVPLFRHDKSGIVPPGIFPILPPKAEPLTEANQIAVEGIAMCEDEVSRFKFSWACLLPGSELGAGCLARLWWRINVPYASHF